MNYMDYTVVYLYIYVLYGWSFKPNNMVDGRRAEVSACVRACKRAYAILAICSITDFDTLPSIPQHAYTTVHGLLLFCVSSDYT